MTEELTVDYRMFKQFCQNPYKFYQQYVAAELPVPDMTDAQLQQFVLGQLVQGKAIEDLEGVTVLDFPDRRSAAYKKAAGDAPGPTMLTKQVQPLIEQAQSVQESPIYQTFCSMDLDTSARFSRSLGDRLFLTARPTLFCPDLGQAVIVRSVSHIHQARQSIRSAWWELAVQYMEFVSGKRCSLLLVEESAPYSTRLFHSKDSGESAAAVAEQAQVLVEMFKSGEWKNLKHTQGETL